MKEYDENKQLSVVNEDQQTYMRTFSSQEEAERYNMIENIGLSDMEKFKLFCRMMRVGKMLSSAKVVK